MYLLQLGRDTLVPVFPMQWVRAGRFTLMEGRLYDRSVEVKSSNLRTPSGFEVRTMKTGFRGG